MYSMVVSFNIYGLVCQAKTAVAPLDRVKILFQTHHHEYTQYAGVPRFLLSFRYRYCLFIHLK